MPRPEPNELEMVLGHAIALRCIRNGPRVPEVAEGLAAYREQLLAELGRAAAAGMSLAEAVEAVRGRLPPVRTQRGRPPAIAAVCRG